MSLPTCPSCLQPPPPHTGAHVNAAPSKSHAASQRGQMLPRGRSGPSPVPGSAMLSSLVNRQHLLPRIVAICRCAISPAECGPPEHTGCFFLSFLILTWCLANGSDTLNNSPSSSDCLGVHGVSAHPQNKPARKMGTQRYMKKQREAQRGEVTPGS